MPISTRGTTESLIRIVDMFRVMNNDFPSQYIHTFLTVAMRQGCSNKDVAEITGLSQAAVSRNLKVLGPDRYNLIDLETHPEDGRRRLAYLTEQGEELYRKVLKELGHKETDPLPEPEEPYSFKPTKGTVPPPYYAPTKTVHKKGESEAP